MKKQEAAGAVAGGAAGAAGAIGAVSALGVPGLSAAGITSGLAAVGGGTMIVGLAVTAAAPLALAAVGYGLFRWLRED